MFPVMSIGFEKKLINN